MSHHTVTRKPGSNGGYGHGRPKFSPEERQEILAALDRGESMTAIARRHDCTPGAIYYHARTTLRITPGRDLHAEETAAYHRCHRCGIDTTAPDLCADCVDVGGRS